MAFSPFLPPCAAEALKQATRFDLDTKHNINLEDHMSVIDMGFADWLGWAGRTMPWYVQQNNQ